MNSIRKKISLMLLLLGAVLVWHVPLHPAAAAAAATPLCETSLEALEETIYTAAKILVEARHASSSKRHTHQQSTKALLTSRAAATVLPPETAIKIKKHVPKQLPDDDIISIILTDTLHKTKIAEVTIDAPRNLSEKIYLKHLSVKKSHQKKGIGSTLFGILKYLADQQCRSLDFIAMPILDDDNHDITDFTPAIRHETQRRLLPGLIEFYKKCGAHVVHDPNETVEYENAAPYTSMMYTPPALLMQPSFLSSSAATAVAPEKRHRPEPPVTPAPATQGDEAAAPDSKRPKIQPKEESKTPA
jgi:GNAT superfamily N-acetyltransferase